MTLCHIPGDLNFWWFATLCGEITQQPKIRCDLILTCDRNNGTLMRRSSDMLLPVKLLFDFSVPDLADSPRAALWCGRKQWTNLSLVRRSVSTRPSCNNQRKSKLQTHMHTNIFITCYWMHKKVFQIKATVHIRICILGSVQISQSVQWLGYGVNNQGSIPNREKRVFSSAKCPHLLWGCPNYFSLLVIFIMPFTLK